MPALKKNLDRFYKEYNFKERIKHDPIEFPRRYSDSDDIEIAGFIASCFAYGKVDLFKPVIEKILKPGGGHPAAFFKNFALIKDKKHFQGVSYRFNKEKDILCLAYILNHALNEWGSLKNLFYHFYNSSMSIPAEREIHARAQHKDIGYALSKFVNYFMGINTSPVYGRNIKPYGLKQLFPSPENNSACKRLNLFLRWMVRTNDIDLGLWSKIPPSELIIPLDTHIARISRCLGLTKRKSSDWKTATEITQSLKKLDSDDPLKYDFALCHYGVSGMCTGTKSARTCASCVLLAGRASAKSV